MRNKNKELNLRRHKAVNRSAENEYNVNVGHRKISTHTRHTTLISTHVYFGLRYSREIGCDRQCLLCVASTNCERYIICILFDRIFRTRISFFANRVMQSKCSEGEYCSANAVGARVNDIFFIAWATNLLQYSHHHRLHCHILSSSVLIHAKWIGKEVCTN